jgi:tRNA pseudouridine38-40 synthase
MSLAQAGAHERPSYAAYKSIVAYDGTDFKGFQRQAEGIRTVQSVIEHSLREIGWQGSGIKAAGRTDTGVHARGQVISFQLPWRQGMDQLARALNATLPSDISIRHVEPAPEGFHPRFSAICRRYSYSILVSDVRDPFLDRYAWRINGMPDVDAMNSALNALIGEHDFGAFGTAPLAEGSTVRAVYEACWEGASGQLRLNIKANAFLFRMVRRIVMVSLEVGRGRVHADEVRRMLEHPGQIPASPLAPPQGLCLEEVRYDD